MTSAQLEQTEALRGDRHVARKEEIPTDPDPGNYVVVDVMHFSTTVVELLENGAEYVHVTDERGDEFDFRDDNPGARIGGGSTDDYEPTDGYDFFNSPSYVQRVDVAGRPVSMTSTNGGQAVVALRDAPGVDVYVGTTTNAAALARHLRGTDRPTYLVSAGSGGEEAIEDHLGAALVARYLDGAALLDVEETIYRGVLEVAKGHDYVDSHERRRRDVRDYVLALNERAVVPRLDGDRLVDAAAAATRPPTSASD
ncbi:MAG: 2-phosphosulfolactate phosphatase [Haloferacaceae archaeon]